MHNLFDPVSSALWIGGDDDVVGPEIFLESRLGRRRSVRDDGVAMCILRVTNLAYVLGVRHSHGFSC